MFFYAAIVAAGEHSAWVNQTFHVKHLKRVYRGNKRWDRLRHNIDKNVTISYNILFQIRCTTMTEREPILPPEDLHEKKLRERESYSNYPVEAEIEARFALALLRWHQRMNPPLYPQGLDPAPEPAEEF